MIRCIANVPGPGPFKVASEEMKGSALVIVIDPVKPVRSIVSEPSMLPAAHSPATAPDAVFVLAAMTASRKVHKPSALLAVSEVLLTVIVLPAALTDCLVIAKTSASDAAQMRVKSSIRMRVRGTRNSGMAWSRNQTRPSLRDREVSVNPGVNAGSLRDVNTDDRMNGCTRIKSVIHL